MNIWQGWNKNINYPRIDQLQMWQQAIRSGHGCDSDLFLYLMLTKQTLGGCQYVVQKRVTDDLMNTHLGNIRFADLMWPCDSIEMYFEDPNLPTIILQRRTFRQFEQELEQHKLPAIAQLKHAKPDDMFVRVLSERGVYALQVNLTSVMFDHWAMAGGPVPTMEGGFESFDSQEVAGLHALSLLAYKVMVYAAIPQLAPQQVTKRALHYGGRPGVRGRPATPILHVVDLPRQYRADKEKSTREGVGHSFRGRHGHFHTFRSKVFVKKRGTTDYWPPVLGPDGTLPKVKYRIRKL